MKPLFNVLQRLAGGCVSFVSACVVPLRFSAHILVLSHQYLASNTTVRRKRKRTKHMLGLRYLRGRHSMLQMAHKVPTHINNRTLIEGRCCLSQHTCPTRQIPVCLLMLWNERLKTDHCFLNFKDDRDSSVHPQHQMNGNGHPLRPPQQAPVDQKPTSET